MAASRQQSEPPEHNPPDGWFRVVLRTERPDDVSSRLLRKLDIGGTEVRDTPNGDRAKDVILYLERSAATSADAVAATIENVLADEPPIPDTDVTTVEPYDDTDWATAWREHFEPLMLSPRIRVGPPWDDFEAPEPPERTSGPTATITLDPGMAFGTGTHETTQLAATLLDERLAEWVPDDGDHSLTMLDVGCGSGILSIASVKLGIHNVLGIDISEDAIEAAHNNAEINGVSDCTQFSTTPIEQLTVEYPIVVANMLSHLLAEIRRPLVEAVEPGGVLIISGIKRDEVDAFAGEFGPEEWTPTARRLQGDWAGLEWQKPNLHQ